MTKKPEEIISAFSRCGKKDSTLFGSHSSSWSTTHTIASTSRMELVANRLKIVSNNEAIRQCCDKQ
jgi:hypothetical protein